MGISIEFADNAELQARIKVVGVGGGGGNAINTMIASGLDGVEFIAANTDAQSLESNLAPTKLQLGPQLTKGLGAGGTPEVGRKAALEDVQRLGEMFAGCDMVFITAGMGGGTGTGAAPIIAQVARDQGALTVGVVTKPFAFEGKRRSKNAESGISDLIQAVDTIITIPNQKLLTLDEGDDLSLLEAFQKADDVLLQAVRGISDLIINAGMINVDFADVKTIMSTAGRALMGTGFGKGERRALDAAEMAINSPLLDDVSITGATGILINFTAGPDIRLREINEAASLIQQSAHEDANIIFGVVTDPDISEIVKVTVIATGFDAEASMQDDYSMGRHSRLSAPTRKVGRPMQQPSFGGIEPREAVIRAARRPAETHHEAAPISISQSRTPARAFGPSAIHDEAVLDIPAYLRRNAPAQE